MRMIRCRSLLFEG